MAIGGPPPAMSSLTPSPAELFLQARDADPALRQVAVEFEEAEGLLLAEGDLRVLVYQFRDDDPRQSEMHARSVARGAGVLALLTDSVVPDRIGRLLHELPHFDYLEAPHEPQRLARHLRRLFSTLRWEREAREARSELAANRDQLKEIQSIGIALSAERNLDTLLTMIVEKARQITHADAGSLYIVEGDRDGDDTQRRLRFKISQNDSIQVPFSEFTLPLDASSIAGYVATSRKSLILDDCYLLPDDSPVRFNKSFDEKFSYRTKSMLGVPLVTRGGEMIGVLQLINRKLDPNVRLTPEKTEAAVIPFTRADVELVESLASAAAVAMDNALLNEEIRNLFEGFVLASVKAIESRDPTTSGHSGRVAELTVGLAEKVDRLDSGPLRELRFSVQQLREIRYASLLHDFGKIGVREEVLVKANKLYPWDYDLVEARFRYVKKALEAGYLKKELALLRAKRTDETQALRALRRKYREELAELDRFTDIIAEANRPTVLAEGNFDALQKIARQTFRDLDGTRKPLLEPHEVANLSIRKGSLNDEEFRQIQSHVTHTYEFLQKISWTRDLKNVPVIAYMHHEKLNGRGYPERKPAPEIPVQSRMMTISDIYDALTASDRPYKKALPAEKALSIIEDEVKLGQLDPHLFEVFVQAGVYKLTA